MCPRIISATARRRQRFLRGIWQMVATWHWWLPDVWKVSAICNRKVALATARFAGTHSDATSGTLWPLPSVKVKIRKNRFRDTHLSLCPPKRYKHRLWFLRWGKKSYDINVLNFNPNSKITHLSTVAVQWQLRFFTLSLFTFLAISDRR